MQQELAEFVQSKRMHELLRESFREFRAPTANESTSLASDSTALAPTIGVTQK
jgi:hypothetical protein